MKLKDWTYTHLFPRLIWALLHIIFNSLKIRSISEEKILELNRSGQRLVYVFWHGQNFIMIKYMAGRNVSIIASPSRDGRLLAGVLRMFGYGIIPGSSDKSPIRAIIQSIRVMKAGRDMALAVDGPKGPIHQMKLGALFLAKKMNAPIVPLANSAFPAWTFRSWDRFFLPRPFSRAVMVFGDPIRVSPDLSEETVQKEIRIIESELNRLTALANRITNPD